MKWILNYPTLDASFTLEISIHGEDHEENIYQCGKTISDLFDLGDTGFVIFRPATEFRNILKIGMNHGTIKMDGATGRIISFKDIVAPKKREPPPHNFI